MAVEDSNTKRCTKCGVVKATTEFRKCSSKSDGLYSYCNHCAKEVIAAWRDANRDGIKSYMSAWRKENKDKVKASSAAWKASNATSIKAYNAAWDAANREARRIIDQNRRARKRSNGGELSRGLAEKLFKLQRGKCACCGKPLGDNYHMDHIMPIALGGTNTDDNIQLLRARCNIQKKAKHPVDFMQQRGFLL